MERGKVLICGDVVKASSINSNNKEKDQQASIVIDRFGKELLMVPIIREKHHIDTKFCEKILATDLCEGELQYDGYVDIRDINRIDEHFCSKITALRREKLDLLLRLLAKYVSSIHYNAFKQKDYSKIPAAGKVLDEEDLFNLIDASLDLWLTAGRFADLFECSFPKKIGAKYCSLVNSGSSANLLAISALTSQKLGSERLKPGDEVVTVAAGFPTTIAPIIQNGLVPVFVDIELGTYNADLDQLEKAISKKTKAIFLAHTLGNPFDVESILHIADKQGLWLIEDNCDALGSKFDGKFTGNFGDISTFSFYPAHHITTGEGGAVISNDPMLIRLVNSFRDWGRDCWCPPGRDNSCGKRFGWNFGALPEGYDHKYVYSHLGYNLKATDFQAALGLSQLAKLDAFIKKRKENFQELFDGFVKRGLDEWFILPKWLEKSDVCWFGFPLTIKEHAPFMRIDLIKELEKNEIGTRLLFAGNMLKQPAIVKNDVNFRVIGDLHNTEIVSRNTFWIGVWPGIFRKDLEKMLEVISKFVENCD